MQRECDRPTVRADYLARKPASYRVSSPYSYYVLGRVSLRITPWFLAAGLSANAVTFLGFVLLALALSVASAASLGPYNFVLAGVLLHGVMVLDNIDGCVAESTATQTSFGAFADALVAWIQQLALPLCVGWALSRSPPEWWTTQLGLTIAPWCWLALGAARSLACMLTIAVGQFAQRVLQVEGYAQRVRWQGGLLAARALLEGEPLFLVVAPLVGLMGLAHIGYALFHLGVLVVVVAKNATDMYHQR